MDVNDFLIDEEKTMIEAMQQLDEVAKKSSFCCKERLLCSSNY
ncbi:hypothetical protein [Halolactibacillus sp. JCM 19043]|nr:hypothetical protein [Halolactibacillus sp. JCM 19043]